MVLEVTENILMVLVHFLENTVVEVVVGPTAQAMLTMQVVVPYSGLVAVVEVDVMVMMDEMVEHGVTMRRVANPTREVEVQGVLAQAVISVVEEEAVLEAMEKMVGQAARREEEEAEVVVNRVAMVVMQAQEQEAR